MTLKRFDDFQVKSLYFVDHKSYPNSKTYECLTVSIINMSSVIQKLLSLTNSSSLKRNNRFFQISTIATSNYP